EYYRAYLKQLICLIPSYWKLHHQIRSLAFQNRLKAKPCRWKESIIFDQFLMPYLKKGWIKPERWTSPDGSLIIDSVKTSGKTAIIELPLEKIPDSPTFNLDIHLLQVYLNPPRWKQQRVSLYINRHKIKSWVFTNSEYHCETVTAPTSILKNSPLINLRFKMPDARSHLKMGISSDKRNMALNLRLIRFWN
nr:hypothetical protein [Candidatus Delongbacteria bacterium]